VWTYSSESAEAALSFYRRVFEVAIIDDEKHRRIAARVTPLSLWPRVALGRVYVAGLGWATSLGLG
jgi:hypothetical protein